MKIHRLISRFKTVAAPATLEDLRNQRYAIQREQEAKSAAMAEKLGLNKIYTLMSKTKVGTPQYQKLDAKMTELEDKIATMENPYFKKMQKLDLQIEALKDKTLDAGLVSLAKDPNIKQALEVVKKSHPKAVKDYIKRTLQDLSRDLKNWKLDPNGEPKINLLAEHYAASNLGLSGRHELDEADYEIRKEGGNNGVEDEVKGWERVFYAAQQMAKQLKLPNTNAIILIMSHHEKASKRYER